MIKPIFAMPKFEGTVHNGKLVEEHATAELRALRQTLKERTPDHDVTFTTGRRGRVEAIVVPESGRVKTYRNRDAKALVLDVLKTIAGKTRKITPENIPPLGN